jgi:hypothetical protein
MRVVYAAVAVAVVATLPTRAYGGELEACATDAEHAADLRDAGHLRDALRAFESCSKDACPRVVREDCRNGVAEIRRSGPHLVLRARDTEGHDVADATLTIDGESVGPDALATGTLVDPGKHVVRATHARFTSAEQIVVTTALDGLRTIDLSLGPPSAPASGAPHEAPHQVYAPARNRTAAWVVGGVGLAFVAGFAALGTWTYSDYRDLENTCGTHCDHDDVNRVRTHGLIADVSLGVGIVALAVGTYLWFTAPTRTTEARGSAALVAW